MKIAAIQINYTNTNLIDFYAGSIIFIFDYYYYNLYNSDDNNDEDENAYEPWTNAVDHWRTRKKFQLIGIHRGLTVTYQVFKLNIRWYFWGSIFTVTMVTAVIR